MGKLRGKTIAILVADGFEESEFVQPKNAVEKEGAKVDVISLQGGTIKSWKDGNWGSEYGVDKVVDEVSASDYNSLILPGGVISPDQLRRSEDAVSFVRDFVEQKKPVSAICHGVWLLAEADVLEGRKVTSFSSIRTDLTNAGAIWVNEEVVVDSGLTTSRSPHDLPAFCRKIVEEIGEGKHQDMASSA